ncbi:DUF2007 domain-containing protein [Sphingomonas bacterium]|uniref:DUF2007 domain-containing protein n=1 Tax=Sphingomonas bacterium TaxID=1895847 RepID=UPI00261B1E0F|nr:DUF2007 domain-containing protein [Sphingomonas bacterium]MDB5679030.1 hypothetical protein [Sphingomonas bacterium]
MAAIEIGRFDTMVADIIIGRLHADGIAAFPLPYSSEYRSGVVTGILVDEDEAEAARSIIAASDADFPE